MSSLGFGAAAVAQWVAHGFEVTDLLFTKKTVGEALWGYHDDLIDAIITDVNLYLLAKSLIDHTPYKPLNATDFDSVPGDSRRCVAPWSRWAVFFTSAGRWGRVVALSRPGFMTNISTAEEALTQQGFISMYSGTRHVDGVTMQPWGRRLVPLWSWGGAALHVAVAVVCREVHQVPCV